MVFKKISDSIDVSQMVAALYYNHEVWEHIKARQETPGSPHSETKTIFLRWAPDQSVEAAFNQIDAVNYPAYDLLPEAADLVSAFCEATNPTKIGRVIITQLKPYGLIDPHVDDGAYPDHYQRFHIPISCGAGSVFYGKKGSGDTESARMKAGELWWFDNKQTHWVENMCDAPRVHMIIDAVVPGMQRDYDKIKEID